MQWSVHHSVMVVIYLYQMLVLYPFWAATGIYSSTVIRGSRFERWFSLVYFTTWHLLHWVPLRGWIDACVWLIFNVAVARFLVHQRLGPILLLGWGFTSMMAVLCGVKVGYWDVFIFVVYFARTLYATRSKK